MSERERATRAVLAALAGGAPPADALRAGANATGSAHVSAAFRAAADDLRGDAFRRDVITRARLEPPVVGVLLARAPREALAAVAQTVLRAARRPRRGWHRIARVLYLCLLALLEIAVATVAGKYVLQLQLVPGAHAELVTAGAVLAALAILLVTAGGAFESGRLRLETPELMDWLVAAELAGLPPGAALEALSPSASVIDRARLSRLTQKVRGAASVGEAMTTWAERGGLQGPLSKVVGLVAEGEAPAQAAARVARIAAALRGPRSTVRPTEVIGALLVVAGAGLIAGAIYHLLSALGGVTA